MYVNVKEAMELLEDAYSKNPGDWKNHSINVAKAAEAIASRIPDMNSNKAYSLGLLHDLGRINGFSYLKHVIDGYDYLSDMNYDENAKICITHSFPIKEIDAYSGKNDCSQEDTNRISDLLNQYEYDDYDLLIQLCDAISLPDTHCIVEKRLIDVAIRHGVNNYSIDKWKSYIRIKEYFDKKVGQDIYKLLKIIY